MYERIENVSAGPVNGSLKIMVNDALIFMVNGTLKFVVNDGLRAAWRPYPPD
jgi:hypothetical protein